MTSARAKAGMKKTLIEQRDRLLAEIEALKNKVAGLEMAISLMDRDGNKPATGAATSSGTSVKAAILDLLREVGTTGLNADSAVEIANRRGISLHRGSVSSTLSRMKSENVVSYDGKVYRLPEFSRANVESLPLPEASPSPIRRVRLTRRF
jgi:hypothetical protein